MAGQDGVTPFHRFPVLRTSNLDDWEETLVRTYGAKDLDVSDRTNAWVLGNFTQLHDLTLGYTAIGSGCRISYRGDEYARMRFMLRGNIATKSEKQASLATVGKPAVVSPHRAMISEYSDDTEMMFLRVSTDSLNRKLAALAGFVPKRPIDLQPSDFTSPDLVLGLQSLVESFVRQLADERVRISPIALKEQEQAIVVQFLLACRHNFSALLETDECPFIPAAVRLAAEYIDANCGGPVTIEALAEASGVSARTLFKSFSKAYGVSPKIFVKKRRLERARKLLAGGGPNVSVTAIAFACGFTNIGHFAYDYRTAFGELPSETLARRSRRISGSG